MKSWEFVVVLTMPMLLHILQEDQKRNHYLNNVIFAHHHEIMRHTHQEAVIGSIRHPFWISWIKTVVKKVVKRCQICKLEQAKLKPLLMGQWLEDRLTLFIPPFSYVWLDYFGPIIVTFGRRHEKRWVALFTCLTIRTIHIEIWENLSTDAYLMCIRNFINRQVFWFEKVATLGPISLEHIVKWGFNCPSNPHAGGCWKRMV